MILIRQTVCSHLALIARLDSLCALLTPCLSVSMPSATVACSSLGRSFYLDNVDICPKARGDKVRGPNLMSSKPPKIVASPP